MQFFGINLYKGTYHDFFQSLFAVKKPTLVFTPNPEILYRAYHDEEFMGILKQADYNLPDGNGLYVGSMMQEGRGFLHGCHHTFFQKKKTSQKYGELIKGSDLVREIMESGKSTKTPLKILIIDRKNTVPKNDLERKKAEMQKKLKSVLEEKYSGTEIHAIFDGEMAPDGIAHYIELHKIDFVFSCIGMKNQEKRLAEIFSYLPEKIPVVGLGVGASIDFLLGLQKRAPKVFRDSGLEWFYRLITQPRIRYKRIKTALIDFPQLVKKSIKKKYT